LAKVTAVKNGSNYEVTAPTKAGYTVVWKKVADDEAFTVNKV
jgi:hypothetical protein